MAEANGPLHVAVIGSGVIGLSVASRLATDGCTVTVIADHGPGDTVSAVAGAIWFPHLIDTSDATIRQLRTSRQAFEQLATDPSTGIVVRAGTLIERRLYVDRAWIAAVDAYELAPATDLPPGATAGVRARLPIIDMSRYLQWLERRCGDQGVAFVSATVATLDELSDQADAIVVAAGLRSPALLGDDDSVFPVRGQVVRLANPGLRDWLIDDENPAGMLYVLPRTDDIVVGGTSERGRVDLAWDPVTEASILERATIAVPALAGLPIVSRAVGLRPARPSLRVEPVAGWAIPVIACYGHGGAGVSTSWGSADAVAGIVAGLRSGGATLPVKGSVARRGSKP